MKSRLIISLVLLLVFKNINAQSAPIVVTSIKPIHSLVSSLMEGIDSPELLLKSNNSAHTFHIKPSQIRVIENADLVISIGDEFEIGLRKALKNLNDSTRFEIIKLNNLKILKYRADKIYETTDQEKQIDESETNDMHLWLDIDNMKKISSHIHSKLIDIDPRNKQKYNKNLDLLTIRLDSLQAELEKQMLPFAAKTYGTYSDTIQYFENSYNLGRPVIVTPYHGARLSINRTLASKNTMNDLKVSCLIYGNEVRKSQISVLSEGLNLKTAELDILGQEFNPGPDLYFKLMKKIANQVVSCLE